MSWKTCFVVYKLPNSCRWVFWVVYLYFLSLSKRWCGCWKLWWTQGTLDRTELGVTKYMKIPSSMSWGINTWRSEDYYWKVLLICAFPFLLILSAPANCYAWHISGMGRLTHCSHSYTLIWIRTERLEVPATHYFC